VVFAIVKALWSLGQKAVKGPLIAVVTVMVIILYFLGFNEIALLFAGGLAIMAVLNFRRLKGMFCGHSSFRLAWFARIVRGGFPHSLCPHGVSTGGSARGTNFPAISIYE